MTLINLGYSLMSLGFMIAIVTLIAIHLSKKKDIIFEEEVCLGDCSFDVVDLTTFTHTTYIIYDAKNNELFESMFNDWGTTDNQFSYIGEL